MAAIEDLERRVVALEARVRSTEVDMASVNEKLNGLVGGQDVIIGTVRDQGALLSLHNRRLEAVEGGLAEVKGGLAEVKGGLAEVNGAVGQLNGKMDIVIEWIQAQP